MAAANMVTLGPEVEAAEAEVGVGTLDTKTGVEVGVGTLDTEMGIEVGVGTLGNTAPQVEANGRERLLRADGKTIVECRALGILVLDLLLTQHLGFNRLLLPLQILMGVKR